jgi:hypothetical protein
MNETNLIKIHQDPPELEIVLDHLSKIAEEKILRSPQAKPLVMAFYYVDNKIAVLPLLTDVPLVVWENSFLQTKLYHMAYSALAEDGIRNLAIIFPTIRYTFNKNGNIPDHFLNKKTISIRDLSEWHQAYPDLVRQQPTLQYFVDIDGQYHQAYADVRCGKFPTLSEYVICDHAKNSVIFSMNKARNKVFS